MMRGVRVRTRSLQMNIHLLAVASLSGKVAWEGIAIDVSITSDYASANTLSECVEKRCLQIT